MNMFDQFKNPEEILKFINSKRKLERSFLFIIGLLLIAISFNLFLLPNEIVYGGVSGLSIIIKRLFGITPSTFIFYAYIFLLFCSALLLGKKKTINSIMGSLLLPLFIKLTENIGNYILLQDMDILLATVYGGILSGVGIGLIFRNGYTTGGTDIINQIIHKYFKLSIGHAMIIIDGIIIFGSSLILGPKSAMYGIIALYIVSTLTDKVILGISSCKAFYIITSKPDEVKSYILNQLSHGITILDAHGGYSDKKLKVLMCIIPTKNYYKAKEGISTIDDEAFFFVSDSYEVVGGEYERINL